jgi:hypothetical protein
MPGYIPMPKPGSKKPAGRKKATPGPKSTRSTMSGTITSGIAAGKKKPGAKRKIGSPKPYPTRSNMLEEKKSTVRGKNKPYPTYS